MATVNLDSLTFTKDDERDALAAAEHRADHEVEPDWDDTDADGCAICDRADHTALVCPERAAEAAQPIPTPKEVVMSFAYKADLIYEIMVTQRNEPTTFVPKIADSTPSQCRRCAGTGRFITGTLNGKPVGPGGPCFRCAGKGFQTKADSRRNWGYDNFGQRVDVGPKASIVAIHLGGPACPACGATEDHGSDACDAAAF